MQISSNNYISKSKFGNSLSCDEFVPARMLCMHLFVFVVPNLLYLLILQKYSNVTYSNG